MRAELGCYVGRWACVRLAVSESVEGARAGLVIAGMLNML